VAPPTSTTQLIDSKGNPIGTAALFDAQFGVVAVLKLKGLPPGQHGFHVHQRGACDPPSFESSGPHYNPQGRQHGLDNPKGPHAGDMPNLTVRSDGTVDTTLTLLPAMSRPGAIGRGSDARSLIIHADRDDQVTDPSGNSGARIACGVVQK
jgi:Cu-Zn family superoxide dismutase